MPPLDRESLKTWYRAAMSRRADELDGLRRPLAEGASSAPDAIRRVGHALRGSGGTFGFPEVSFAGALLEDALGQELTRRVDGVVALLRRVSGEETKVTPGGRGEEPDAWARETAARYGLRVAATLEPSRAALRLVPPALLREHSVLPLSEDGTHIEVATADPTDLSAEAALQRITGRVPVFAVAHPERLGPALAAVLGDEPSGPAPAVQAPPRSPTVLVVDDDPATRLIARTVLERRDFRVVEAGDGEAALSVFSSDGSIDLAVVDLGLPGMDGRELVQRLRGTPRGGDVPIVVLTGAESPDLEADLIEAGADDYIHKPLDPRLFVARVAATLRRSRA